MEDRSQTAPDNRAWEEWLTVAEAAEYLSNCSSEIFNESRIYKEAIAYRLRLSLYFHDGHPAKMFEIERTKNNPDYKLEFHSDHPLQYNSKEIVAIYDGCAHPLNDTYKGMTTQLHGVYDLTLLGCGKSLIRELRFGFDHTTTPDPHGIILERNNSFYQVLEDSDRPLEYTPAFTFPKGSYLVVRDQSLREFEKKFHPLGKGNVSVFIEEMRKHLLEQPISGEKTISDIAAFIQERISDIKGAMGNRRIITQERVLNSSKSKEIIQKSAPSTTEDVSKILYSLRKKYPIPA